jgi:hypothetical protein
MGLNRSLAKIPDFWPSITTMPAAHMAEIFGTRTLNLENPGGFISVVKGVDIHMRRPRESLFSWPNSREVQETFNAKVLEAGELVAARNTGTPNFMTGNSHQSVMITPAPVAITSQRSK